MPIRRPSGADQPGAAPQRMRRRGEQRFVEMIFPVAREFLLGDDARAHGLRTAAPAGHHHGFADRRGARMADRHSRQIERAERLHQPEAGLRIDADGMGRNEAAVRPLQPDVVASVTR